MNIDKLIEKLTKLRDNYGTKEVSFSVSDHYSVYGKSMSMNCSEDAEFYQGTTTSDGFTTIHFGLDKDYEGKYPKITFRKS